MKAGGRPLRRAEASAACDVKNHNRAKHEAMLRREMMRALANWPTSPYAIPEPSQEEKVAFCEAFVAMSRPRSFEGTLCVEPAQRELFDAP